MIFMLVMPAWAFVYNIQVWLSGGSFGLVIVALVMLAIEIWLIIEGIILWGQIQGVLEQPLERIPTVSQRSDDLM
jgi:carbon starvation protein